MLDGWQRGYDFVAGLEVEFHIFKLEDAHMSPEHAGQPGAPPAVSLLSHGYQYLTEQRYDQMEPVLEIIRRDVLALGLPLRSVEVEFGPSQCEFTFAPTTGLAPADNMVLFRSAVKQIARRHGYHATFMCRPKLPNVFASGWHLHQSLVSRESGENAFMAKDGGEPLSPFGQGYLADCWSMPAPRPCSPRRPSTATSATAPIRWRRIARSGAATTAASMIRVLGGPGDAATRLENRIGEPAANPYLYMASQILSGLDGVDRGLDPGPSADTPYETKAALLPRRCAKRCPRCRTIRSSARRWARNSSTITSTSRTPRSSGFRPRCRNGSSANISRCFDAVPLSGRGDLVTQLKGRAARDQQDWPPRLSRSIPARRQVHLAIRKHAIPYLIWPFKDRIGPILPLQPMRRLCGAHDVSRDLGVQMGGYRYTRSPGNS